MCLHCRFQYSYDRSGLYIIQNVKESMLYHLRIKDDDRVEKYDRPFHFRLDIVVVSVDRYAASFIQQPKKIKNTAATLFCFWSLKREQLQKLRRAECLDLSTDTLTHALSSTLWTCLIVSWELIWYTYEYH